MNALDFFDDRPDEYRTQIPAWVASLQVGDEVIRESPRGMRGPITVIARGSDLSQTQYQIQFPLSSTWVYAKALAEKYKPGRAYGTRVIDALNDIPEFNQQD